jgi:hypothetical protein
MQLRVVIQQVSALGPGISFHVAQSSKIARPEEADCILGHIALSERERHVLSREDLGLFVSYSFLLC